MRFSTVIVGEVEIDPMFCRTDLPSASALEPHPHLLHGNSPMFRFVDLYRKILRTTSIKNTIVSSQVC